MMLSRDKIRQMNRLLKLSESNLRRDEGQLTETLYLGGNPTQPSREEAARTGLGRLALDMEPAFDNIPATAEDGRGTYDGGSHEVNKDPNTRVGEAFGDPKPDHGETAMGTQDPMGQDEPVHDQDRSVSYQDGMVKPADRRGYYGTMGDLKLFTNFRESVLASCMEQGMTEEEAMQELGASLLSFGASMDVLESVASGDLYKVIAVPSLREGMVSTLNEIARRRIRRRAGSISRQMHQNIGESRASDRQGYDKMTMKYNTDLDGSSTSRSKAAASQAAASYERQEYATAVARGDDEYKRFTKDNHSTLLKWSKEARKISKARGQRLPESHHGDTPSHNDDVTKHRTHALQKIKALGMHAQSTGYGNEIRVAYGHGEEHEPSAYYTDDPHDAYLTAKTMSSRKPKVQEGKDCCGCSDCCDTKKCCKDCGNCECKNCCCNKPCCGDCCCEG
jgi:hypothetical protein